MDVATSSPCLSLHPDLLRVCATSSASAWLAAGMLDGDRSIAALPAFLPRGDRPAVTPRPETDL